MIDQAAFAELGIAVVAAADVEQRVPCPRCARRARDNALGVNIGTGVFHCFRCGWRGRVGTGETARMPERINAALKNAKANRWLTFLGDTTDNRRELVEFLKRAVGYSLTAKQKTYRFRQGVAA